jgi:hypothetical protein
VLVVGTGVLAFRSGFAEARAFGGVVAWVLAAVLALVLPRERLRLSRAGALLVAGLALLTVWTAIAKSWSPLPDLAGDDLERRLLYLGALVAALLAFSEPAARRWLEPGLALVALIIIGYGLAGRFLPGVLEYDVSVAAGGRLEQPLRYWNAIGALAAIGGVLAVRLAGDPTRGRLRVVAGAALPVLGLGLYLSFSRGALLAVVLGLAALLVLVPRRSQLAVVAIAVAGEIAGALLVQHYPTVEKLAAGGDPEREGLEMLLLTVLLCALAAVATWFTARRDREHAEAPVSRQGRRAVAAIVAVALLIPVIGAPLELEAGDAPREATAERLQSLGSSRYAYWRVALESVPDHPLKGVGPAGYQVVWMRERPIDEAVRDAHSLQLETAAELGLPGLAALALIVAGAFAGAGLALRRRGPAVAGTVAALVAWTVTISVDWIWEMPPVALFGLLLSAALAAETGTRPAPAHEG